MPGWFLLLAAGDSLPGVEAPPGAGTVLTETAWTILLAWLVGATPFGYLAGRLKGIDIRQHGSGNIGATNVLRTLGKPVGIAVLVLDALKGLAPVLLAQRVTGEGDSLVPILAAIAAIVGHNYTFWLRFRGGKGIATSAGAMVPLMPLALAVAVLLWLLCFAATRYVSLASIAAALSLPVTLAIQSYRQGQADVPLLCFAAFLAVMATWRHRSNIQRLFRGEESRFEPGKKPPPGSDDAGDAGEGRAS